MRHSTTDKRTPFATIVQVATYAAGALLAVAAFVQPASADPVHVTSGYFVTGEDDSLLRLVSAGFAIGGSADVYTGTPAIAGACAACSGGDSVQMTATLDGGLSGGSAAFGPLRLGGTGYEDVSYFGSLTFESSPFTFPTTTSGYVRVLTPFNMAGALRGESRGTTLFSASLMGHGVAASDFVPVTGGGYALIGSRYEFSASPVPEPASMFLLATGLAGVAAARRRRPDESHRHGGR